MRPWSVGTRYDKPIPRRLVEGAGVQRGMFGNEKKAVAVVADMEGFDKTMTKESFADFSNFVREHYTFRMAAKLQFYKVAQYLARINRILNRRIASIISQVGGKRITLPLLVPSSIERLGRSAQYSLLFHWSIRKLLPRYTVKRDEEYIGRITD
jgi:hypothetical protein